MPDVSTSEEAIAALRESVLPALEAAVTEHRDAIDPLLDGPTARVLDLVGADLAAEAPPSPSECFLLTECYVSSFPARDTRMGRRQT